jgi:hypothetical protein
MKIKNALKLYRFLKKLPESKFDFTTLAETVKNHKCGSVGCMAGYCPSADPALSLVGDGKKNAIYVVWTKDVAKIEQGIKQNSGKIYDVINDFETDGEVLASYLGISEYDAQDLFYKDDYSVKTCKLACLNEFNKLVIQETQHSLDYWDEYYAKKEAKAKRGIGTVRQNGKVVAIITGRSRRKRK